MVRVKLKAFPEELEKRQKVVARYNEKLSGSVVTPFVPEGYLSSWAQYSVLTENRDEVLTRLQKAGIPTAIYYPKPLHIQDAFQDLGYKYGDFPISEYAAERIFSLPMHPYLQDEEIDHIAACVREAVK